ncbi:MAG: molybdopterin-dependent oxidoreductase [Myxococcales bacterium]|nr:molybdopterin-dependent oxidoreductase [Myxococcales bacterium]
MAGRRTHLRTCNLCEAMCGLEFELEGRDIVAVRGDRDDVFSRGYLCPKGPALAQLHADPDRLRRPMRREGDRWLSLDWDEALDEAAAGLVEVQREHGKDALAVYLGNPAVHNHAVALYGPPFLRALRTRHRYSATSVDQLPQMLAAYLMFGHQLLLPIPDIDRAEYLLIIGANPLVSNGSIMSAPDMRRRLRELQGRGGQFTVVDPRRTETAQLADLHLFIRPGSDALLLLALLQVILGEGRERPGRLTALLSGAERVRAAIEPFTPARVEGATGIPASQIRTLAHTLIERRGVVYGRVGASTQAFGSLTHWAINLLNIFTGALDRPGGAMFPQPAVDPLTMPRGLGIGPGSFGRWRSRVRGLPEFGGELPLATLSEDILAGDELPVDDDKRVKTPIRALLTLAGNPVLSGPDGRGLDRALAQLRFMVSIDMYQNETTRHANLILPPSSPLERSHYDLVFHLLAVRHTSKWSPPLFERPSEARHDWEILHGLWTRVLRLRGEDHPLNRSVHELLARLGPDGILDLGLRSGRHGRVLPEGAASLVARLPGRLANRLGGRLDLETLRRHPHGIDLGPLESCLPQRLPKGRTHIDLAPPALLDDLGRLLRSYPTGAHADLRPTPERPRFSLIGRRILRSNNSWMHNLPKLAAGKAPCTLLMHPEDAERLALRPGDQVTVRSRVGAILAPLEISTDLMPGVVSLPHGYGHDRSGTALTVATTRPGASINDITDPRAIDELSGVAAFCGITVEVELATPPSALDPAG